MANDTLPLKVDPLRFADNAMYLQGSLPLEGMTRLLSSLATPEGKVAVTLQFGVDEQKIRFLRGRVAGDVQLQCQRCLEPFAYPIQSEFSLGMVKTDQDAEDLPPSYDPLVIAEQYLFIQDVIEDELIMSLPIVPMHKPQDCQLALPLVAKATDESEMENDNPFKVVELLRKTRDPK